MLGIPVVVSNKGSGHCPLPALWLYMGGGGDQPSVEQLRQYWGPFHRFLNLKPTLNEYISKLRKL